MSGIRFEQKGTYTGHLKMMIRWSECVIWENTRERCTSILKRVVIPTILMECVMMKIKTNQTGFISSMFRDESNIIDPDF